MPVWINSNESDRMLGDEQISRVSHVLLEKSDYYILQRVVDYLAEFFESIGMD